MSRTRRQAEALPSGAQVQTESSRDSSPLPLSGTLRLRGEPLAQATATTTTTETASTRRIRWSEDVVDNEGMGKKSSKVCCIYHKSHPVGESSSESESDDSSSSDSDSDSDSDARQRGIRGRRRQDKACEGHHECGSEEHDHEHEHDHSHGPGPRKHKSKRRKPSPNAYERVPNYNKKRPEGQGM